MKHFIIGTAGHIDHGKTTLIRALTGRNTDRLEEEQRRGITIELGFTWFDLDPETRCGIIDVPGHEKFISNMVAGVVGMDLVMMVVAADEGMMPQTKEHLDILELLGIEKTILVINKCDLVEEDWLEMVKEDLKEDLKGTIMENAPVVCLSAHTGEGIDDLKKVISNMIKNEVKAKDTSSIPRLPIDRVFSISGFGTIITGTLISGTIKKGDVLELYPKGISCRVRNIQVHETDKESCEAGQRVALNLTNVKREDIERGCVLAPEGSMKNTDRIDVRLNVLPDSQRFITNRERLHLFTGTSEILCRCVLLDKKELGPGEEGLAQLLLEEKITVKRGDRFVVRFYSPLETIGGGVVLEPNALKKKRFDDNAIDELTRKESGSFADVCELHIREAGQNLISLQELAKITAHSVDEIKEGIEELNAEQKIYIYGVKNDEFYWHRENAKSLGEKLVKDFTAFHKKYPYREGMRRAELHNTYMKKVKLNVFDQCVDTLVADKMIEENRGFIREHGYVIPEDAAYKGIRELMVNTLENAGYNLLRLDEIDLKKYPKDTVVDILQLLVSEEQVVHVVDEVYTMKHFTDDCAAFVREYFASNEVLTIAQVRDHFATSRKCAKILVEYMDQIKVTKKIGAETERVAYK